MNYDVIPTICLCVVAVFAIQGASVYAIVRLLVTGRAIFERQQPQESGRRIGLVDR